jgi:hypothetical protein
MLICLLDLLVHNEFPALFRYSRESREVLRQLRYRHKLVKLRTMVVNTLHALAINAGLSLRAKLLTQGGRKQLSQGAITHASFVSETHYWVLLGSKTKTIRHPWDEYARQFRGPLFSAYLTIEITD